MLVLEGGVRPLLSHPLLLSQVPFELDQQGTTPLHGVLSDTKVYEP